MWSFKFSILTRIQNKKIEAISGEPQNYVRFEEGIVRSFISHDPIPLRTVDSNFWDANMHQKIARKINTINIQRESLLWICKKPICLISCKRWSFCYICFIEIYGRRFSVPDWHWYAWVWPFLACRGINSVAGTHTSGTGPLYVQSLS